MKSNSTLPLKQIKGGKKFKNLTKKRMNDCMNDCMNYFAFSDIRNREA